MTAYVHTTRSSNTGGRFVAQHDKGKSISIAEGHLCVWSSTRHVSDALVALYAPGEWTEAHLDDRPTDAAASNTQDPRSS